VPGAPLASAAAPSRRMARRGPLASIARSSTRASPMTSGAHHSITRGAASDLTLISGPTPAATPIALGPHGLRTRPSARPAGGAPGAPPPPLRIDGLDAVGAPIPPLAALHGLPRGAAEPRPGGRIAQQGHHRARKSRHVLVRHHPGGDAVDQALGGARARDD